MIRTGLKIGAVGVARLSAIHHLLFHRYRNCCHYVSVANFPLSKNPCRVIFYNLMQGKVKFLALYDCSTMIMLIFFVYNDSIFGHMDSTR